MALVDRVKNILLTPKTEWPTIAAEAATPQSLYTGYIMILAAIPALAMVIGFGITAAVVRYVMMLVGPLVAAFIIDALAPTFGGEKNFVQSLKLAAYSFTGPWLAGIFYLIGALGGIIGLIAAIYAWYTLYLGITPLKKSPADKAVAYTLVVLVCSILLAAVAGAIFSTLLFGAAGMGAMGFR